MKSVFPLLFVPTFCAMLFAQQINRVGATDGYATAFEKDRGASAGLYVIYSNLDRSPNALFDETAAFTLAGRTVSGQTEEWQAMRFTPKVDAQAQVLSAAIRYTSGTRQVNLGIYSNNATTNSVGTLLPGGQGSTTDIPDAGECCDLVTVTLPGEGVTLTAGTVYWLVASPDNVSAADFKGIWHLSNFGVYAYLQPPFPWDPQSSMWPAGKIEGEKLAVEQTNSIAPLQADDLATARPGGTVLFTNLASDVNARYDPLDGLHVTGKSAFSSSELSLALPFTVRTSSHAQSLAAAIGYLSGKKKVNLGIYSDSNGIVGVPLPGGQASTGAIPDEGECCDLTRVKLPGAGVALAAGTKYWLVATADNDTAPTFDGRWHFSTLAVGAYQEPEIFVNWTDFSGNWLAAEITGTSP